MMKVGELIALLETYDEGKEVLVKAPLGGTNVTFRVGEEIESFEDVVILTATGAPIFEAS